MRSVIALAVTCVLTAGMVAFAPSCTIRPADGSGGDGGSEGGAGEGGAQGGDGGSSSTGVCEVTDCTACRQCAANGPCEALVDACLNEPTCVAIDECIALCGGSEADCWESCRAQNPVGAELYDPARECLDCVTCDHACYAPYVCGPN